MKKIILLVMLGGIFLFPHPGWAQSNTAPAGSDKVRAGEDEAVSADSQKIKAVYDSLTRQFAKQDFASIYIGFASNSADILPQYMAEIKSIYQLLEQQPDLCLLIQGHTDGLGQPAYNQELSLRRAASIKNALTLMGIAADRLTVEGKGASVPIADNNNSDGREKNRRVELHKRECNF
jgi:outer membrane protein OmpA-like peptidoglycan-associated protein